MGIQTLIVFFVILFIHLPFFKEVFFFKYVDNLSTSIEFVFSSQSTKWGVAPDKSVAFVLATKLKEGINISSFAPTFYKYKAKCSAAVPLDKHITYLALV